MPRKTRRSPPPAAALSAWRGAGPSWLKYVLVGMASLAIGAGGDYLIMRPSLNEAAQSRTMTAQTDRTQGDLEEDQGQWAQAIVSYQQAIAAGTDNPDIRTDLGVAYFKSNQPQKALEQYVIAQSQNPDHENSLFNEASAYAVLGDSARAIGIWKAYLQKFPNGQHVADAKNFIAEVQAHGLSPAVPGKRQ